MRFFRIIEIILIAFIILGLAMRTGKLEGGVFITGIFLSQLAIYYFLFSVFVLNKPVRNANGVDIAISILAGIPLSNLVVGILFGLMRYNGANELMMISLALGGLTLLPVLVYFFKKRTKLLGRLIVRLGVLEIISLALFFGFSV